MIGTYSAKASEDKGTKIGNINARILKKIIPFFLEAESKEWKKDKFFKNGIWKYPHNTTAQCLAKKKKKL